MGGMTIEDLQGLIINLMGALCFDGITKAERAKMLRAMASEYDGCAEGSEWTE